MCRTSLYAACFIARPHSQFLFSARVLFGDILWPEVQSHSDDSHMHVTAPCSARALDQAHLTMSCIHLVFGNVVLFSSDT